MVLVEGDLAVVSEDDAYSQLLDFARARAEAAGHVSHRVDRAPVRATTEIIHRSASDSQWIRQSQQRELCLKAKCSGCSKCSLGDEGKDDARISTIGQWSKRESSRYPGQFFFHNPKTGESSWKTLPALSNWRLLHTMWPAQFLFHGAYVDVDFRPAWLAFTAGCLLVM